MDQKDVRWQQRFQNFEKAFLSLKVAVNTPDLNELEKNGLVQRFEFTIEMAWKTLKDYLEYKEFTFLHTPMIAGIHPFPEQFSCNYRACCN